MVVTVQRDLYGTGKMVKASDLTLGPQSCQPSAQSTNLIVVFQNGLQECGNSLEITPEFMVYSTNLNYNPTPAGYSPIIRTNAASVLIQCYYPRHGNVSSNAIKPTWMPYSSTISAEERLGFSLNLMNDDWSAPRTSTVFRLGDVFHIEASVDSGNHVPMTVFIDSCVATLNPNANSDPSYEIISLNGCLMDGKEADSTSVFMSPRPRPDKLQFTVDAFRFTGRDVSTIYITCSLRVAAATQLPDPVNKACSFSKTSNTWSPLEGTSDICRCCDTGNCVASPSQSRRVNQYNRGRGKRQAGPGTSVEQEQTLATLGPLLVIGPDQNKALAVTQNPDSLEFWVWVAVGSLSLVVLVVCSAVMGKHKQSSNYSCSALYLQEITRVLIKYLQYGGIS
ncbi:zona pellucida sperm-binding protein 3-like [Bombina bombina]|uniref:zona pellucida sperm-binding protein 3-like n=1 Tax=Bombina bombina TaxID=8345 RepID=UPI00235A6EE6|nr:zona pellucida sperm-binding protein 3-like [Bombina bombina]